MASVSANWSESPAWTIARLSACGSVEACCTANAGLDEVPHPGWRFREEAVRTFVREHVYLLDIEQMKQGHVLTTLARVESAAQAWRTAEDLAAYLDVPVEVVRRVVRHGLIPHRRRPGAGRHGKI